MDLSEELNRFLQSQHRRRSSTNEMYGKILSQFTSYYANHPPSPYLQGEGRGGVIVAVSDFLNGKKLKPSTHNLYLSAIATFLFERRLVTREERDELHGHRATIVQQPYSDHALTEADLIFLFEYLRKGNARTNILRQQRDLCIFLLQYACAMRISEVLTLAPGDITEREKSLYVTVRPENSKTGLERSIPLRHNFSVAGLHVAAELKAWISQRLRYAPSSPHLFFNIRKGSLGLPINPARMTEKYNNIKRRCGITSGRSTHSLRHTRITQLANNPAIPMPVISEFAGHFSKGQPNIRTTSLYIQRPKADDVEKYL